jgi:hypothetical protein
VKLIKTSKYQKIGTRNRDKNKNKNNQWVCVWPLKTQRTFEKPPTTSTLASSIFNLVFVIPLFCGVIDHIRHFIVCAMKAIRIVKATGFTSLAMAMVAGALCCIIDEIRFVAIVVDLFVFDFRVFQILVVGIYVHNDY